VSLLARSGEQPNNPMSQVRQAEIVAEINSVIAGMIAAGGTPNLDRVHKLNGEFRNAYMTTRSEDPRIAVSVAFAVQAYTTAFVAAKKEDASAAALGNLQVAANALARSIAGSG